MQNLSEITQMHEVHVHTAQLSTTEVQHTDEAWRWPKLTRPVHWVTGLISRPEGCSQPSELWFSGVHM